MMILIRLLLSSWALFPLSYYPCGKGADFTLSCPSTQQQFSGESFVALARTP